MEDIKKQIEEILKRGTQPITSPYYSKEQMDANYRRCSEQILQLISDNYVSKEHIEETFGKGTLYILETWQKN
jgi:hypothetical protein